MRRLKEQMMAQTELKEGAVVVLDAEKGKGSTKEQKEEVERSVLVAISWGVEGAISSAPEKSAEN